MSITHCVYYKQHELSLVGTTLLIPTTLCAKHADVRSPTVHCLYTKSKVVDKSQFLLNVYMLVSVSEFQQFNAYIKCIKLFLLEIHIELM